MADKWTNKRDYRGDEWNELLQDHTEYARGWEKNSGQQARANAQHWRDRRWQVLDELNRGER